MNTRDNLVLCRYDDRVRTTKDLVEASFVAVYAGHYPKRVVLRQRQDGGGSNEWVVHLELLEMSRLPEDETKTIAFCHVGFESGDYFTDERKARDRFQERASKL